MIIISNSTKTEKHKNYNKFVNFVKRVDKKYGKGSKKLAVVFEKIKFGGIDITKEHMDIIFLGTDLLDNYPLLQLIFLHEYGHRVNPVYKRDFKSSCNSELLANWWAFKYIITNRKKTILKQFIHYIEFLSKMHVDKPDYHKTAAKKFIKLINKCHKEMGL